MLGGQQSNDLLRRQVRQVFAEILIGGVAGSDQPATIGGGRPGLPCGVLLSRVLVDEFVQVFHNPYLTK